VYFESTTRPELFDVVDALDLAAVADGALALHLHGLRSGRAAGALGGAQRLGTPVEQLGALRHVGDEAGLLAPPAPWPAGAR
jgi:hypothetical protein